MLDDPGGKLCQVRISIIIAIAQAEDSEDRSFRVRFKTVDCEAATGASGSFVDQRLKLPGNLIPVLVVARENALKAIAERLVLRRVPLEGNRNVVAKGVFHFRRLRSTARFPRHLGGEVRVAVPLLQLLDHHEQEVRFLPAQMRPRAIGIPRDPHDLAGQFRRLGQLILQVGPVGDHDHLADLTEAQVRALIEEAVEGFREAMADIARAQTPEVPF